MRLDRVPLNVKTSPADGELYIDKPVYKHLIPKYWETEGRMADAVAGAFPSTKTLETLRPRPLSLLDHYDHLRFRWMKPDGKGGLVPK